MINNENNYTLRIDKTQVEDAGVYTIFASNRVGKINIKTELIVQGINIFINEK
jgi:hypothetical protein